MEVKRIVHGDIKAYFKVLTDSLLSDYNAAMQAEYTSDVLKSGLTYQKKLRNSFGNEGTVSVSIDGLKRIIMPPALKVPRESINYLMI